MSTAALLAQVQMTTGNLNYYTQQQIFWAKKYEDSSAKVAKMSKLEEEWVEAYDNAIDHGEGDKELKAGSVVIKKDQTGVSETLAEDYANAKVKGYDEEVLRELEEQDTDYETMRDLYDTLMKEEQATLDSLKEELGKEAQDTHLLN